MNYFLKLSCSLFFAISIFSQSTFAQPGVAAEPSGENLKSDKEFTLTLTLAPTIGSDFDQVRGDNLSDAVTKSSLALEHSINVGEDFKITSSSGVDWTSDFEGDDDDEAKSAFFASSKINWTRGCRRLSPFALLRFERGYSDFFEDRGADSGKFAIGADIKIYDKDSCLSGLTEAQLEVISSFTLTVTPSIERIESNDSVAERWTPRLTISASQKVGGGIKLAGSADYQFRLFDQVASGSNRQHRIAGDAGVDFAELVFGPSADKLVSKLQLGLSWEIVDQENTGSLRDTSNVSFSPKISFSKRF